MLSIPPQHFSPSPCHAVCHATPETEPPRSGFGFLGPIPLPWLAFVNAQPYYHHHIIYTTPAPPPITLSHRLPRHTRNRATTLSFRVLGPSPLSWLMFSNTQSHHHHYLTWGSGPLLCMAGYSSLCELFFIMSKFYFDRVNTLEPNFLVLDNNDIE